MPTPKKNIVICGYPKSGTTWLSRLVADLVDAPFVGDWGYDTKNKSSINLDKTDSPYRVYKSHHLGSQLDTDAIWKIIHLLRDPRDIVVSGAYFFDMPVLLDAPLREKLPTVDRVLSKGLPPKLSLKRKLDRMIEAVLHGDSSITPWMAPSWMQHLESFEGLKARTVYYEGLLSQAETSLESIAQNLEITVSDRHIKSILERQSMAARKEVIDQEHPKIKRLLRKGVAGDYKTQLEQKQISRLAPLMQQTNNPYCKASYL